MIRVYHDRGNYLRRSWCLWVCCLICILYKNGEGRLLVKLWVGFREAVDNGFDVVVDSNIAFFHSYHFDFLTVEHYWNFHLNDLDSLHMNNTPLFLLCIRWHVAARLFQLAHHYLLFFFSVNLLQLFLDAQVVALVESPVMPFQIIFQKLCLQCLLNGATCSAVLDAFHQGNYIADDVGFVAVVGDEQGVIDGHHFEASFALVKLRLLVGVLDQHPMYPWESVHKLSDLGFEGRKGGVFFEVDCSWAERRQLWQSWLWILL